MDRRGGHNGGRKAVPQFGAWDQQGAASPNYSMVFGQARAHRKQAKAEFRPLSLGNEDDLIAQQHPRVNLRHQEQHQDDDSTIMRKNKFLSYCCIRPY